MKQYFCVGTYTEPILFGTGEVFHGKGKGILICAFENGKIKVMAELPIRNPSFLCIDEEKKKIYAVNEMKEYLEAYGGGVTQISYDESWNMKEEKTCNVGGTDPCHIFIAPNGEFLSVSNFADGSVTIIPLLSDGDIDEEQLTVFKHAGCSVHPIRQKGPHAHATVAVPEKDLMYVPDLGIDRMVAYRYEGNKVEPDPSNDISILAGSGPRTGIFSKDGKDFYLICEISSQVIHYKNKNNCLTEKETVNTLPEGYEQANICSDINLTSNGSYLYAANRGHDSLVCFKVGADGELEFVERQSCRGETPRNFAIDPTGEYLLCGNQDSDTISIFAIGEDGKLQFEREQVMGTPVCIKFFENK